jgi:hypothetical protein
MIWKGGVEKVLAAMWLGEEMTSFNEHMVRGRGNGRSFSYHLLCKVRKVVRVEAMKVVLHSRDSEGRGPYPSLSFCLS